MSYQKKNDDAGKISLWENFDDSKSYVFSGTVDIGDEQFALYIYENKQKRNENSPHFYGFLKDKKGNRKVFGERPSKWEGTPRTFLPKVTPIHQYNDVDDGDLDIQF